jgi:hypothetical protein
MTDCTERHPAAPRNGLAGEGHEGMSATSPSGPAPMAKEAQP